MHQTLPVGTKYRSTFYRRVVAMKHEAKLVYHWGAKGHCGMVPVPKYYVPILGGHVGEYVLADSIRE